MEERIWESERWLNTILTSIGDGVISVDQHGFLQFINPAAELITGWNLADVSGKTISEVFPIVDEKTREIVELGKAQNSLDKADIAMQTQALLISKSGKQIPIEVTVSPIRDANNNLQCMIFAFRDITQQQQAMEEIQSQASRAEALANIASQINSDLDLESVLGKICQVMNQTLKAAASAVFLYDADLNAFKIMAAISDVENLNIYKRSQFEIKRDVFESLLSKDNPVVVIPNVQQYPGLPYEKLFHEQGIHSLAIAALFNKNEIIGVLASLSINKERDFARDELIFLKGVADHLATAISNINLFEQMRIGRERQQFLTRQLVKVQEDERRSLSRELHDEIGQMLTGLQFTIKSIMARSTEDQRSKLDQIQIQISVIISQIRELSINLRPSLLDDLGILPTLIWYFDRYEAKTGIRVSFNHQNLDQRFSPELETAAFRIVQEALTNVARYAEAESVDVNINIMESVMQVEIHDQGKGFDITFLSKNQSVGLEGMRERAIAGGGLLEILSQPDKGTHIYATLPTTGQIERRTHERNHLAGR